EALVLNPMKKAMLANNNIAFTDANFESLFDSSFEIETSNGLVLYTTKSTGALNILVDSEGKWSSIKSVLTLETDFETIKKVTVYSQNEKTGAKIETTPEILAALSGLKFEPTIEPFDGMTGATQTMTGFLAGLNTTYAAYFEEFGGNE
ncbi:MAG TPA: FMN-binding protein, partial [Acholeplasma sp.]|nr:FMN-binding protein [Acholeplasma sp.]